MNRKEIVAGAADGRPPHVAVDIGHAAKLMAEASRSWDQA